MMYHSRHFLKQSMSLAQHNGVRQVAVASQRLHLVPAPSQGFFMLTTLKNTTTNNAFILTQMRQFSFPSH